MSEMLSFESKSEKFREIEFAHNRQFLLTLRDRFAIAIVQGFASRSFGSLSPDEIWNQADRMVKARGEG